jgi:hypothetical protein
MSQQFNPKRVLRQISTPLLREFFYKQGYSLEVEWESTQNTLADSVFDAWQGLPDEPRKSVEIIFYDIHEMANEDGILVIIEEAKYNNDDIFPMLESMESRYDKAIWTFLNRPEVWEAAVLFARADSFSYGRSWVKRGNVPKTEPRTDTEGLAALQTALSAFYRERQGRGHYCTVEHFPRGKNLDYFFVYLSDYADTYINFNESGGLQRTAERRAFEIVFAYDRHNVTLEMYARGGKQIIQPLQHVFSQIMLGENLNAEDPNAKQYHLDGLMNRTFSFPTDPEDGIREVSLRSLRLSILGRKRGRITLEPDPEKGRFHIYEMLEEDLNRRRLPKSILHVTKATFNFKLNGNSNGRSLTFSVSYPNLCDLKSKREVQRLLGEKYLKRWSIDVA